MVAMRDGIRDGLEGCDEDIAVQIIRDFVLRAELVDEVFNDRYVLNVRCDCDECFHVKQY
jgi:hypothetical protein